MGRTDAAWRRIVQAYRKGASLKTTYERFGVHPSTLRRHLQRIGEPIRGLLESRALREEAFRRQYEAALRKRLPRGEVCRAYRGGGSLRKLSKQYSVTRPALRKQLLAWGVTISTRHSPGKAFLWDGDDMRRRVTTLHRKLGSASQVANELSVSKSTVLRALRRWGV